MTRRIVVAVTGASGSIYAEKLVEFLLTHVERVYLLHTDSGLAVAKHELSGNPAGTSGLLLDLFNGRVPEQYREVLRLLKNDDLFAPIASGSSSPTDMVVVPCSMGTLARITHGTSSNLIERSADVVLKEKKRLVIVPRETPFNAIHLENMLKLAQLGVHIVPAMPGYYNRPQSMNDLVNFVVGKIVDALGIDNELYKRWNTRMV